MSKRSEEALVSDLMSRMDMIRPILQFPKGSKERREAIEGAVRLQIGNVGKPVSRSNIYKRLKAYENGGLAALMPKGGRADAGKRRHNVTKTWDSFFKGRLDDEAFEEVGLRFRRHVRALCARHGKRTASRLATI